MKGNKINRSKEEKRLKRVQFKHSYEPRNGVHMKRKLINKETGAEMRHMRRQWAQNE